MSCWDPWNLAFLKLAECSHNLEIAKQSPQDLEQLLGLRFFLQLFFHIDELQTSCRLRQEIAAAKAAARDPHLDFEFAIYSSLQEKTKVINGSTYTYDN